MFSTQVGLLADAGVATAEAAWPDRYWLGKECALVDADAADARPGLRAAHEAFSEIVDAHGDGESLLQYWCRRGVTSMDLDVADALYANDYGAGASDLGAAEVAHEQRHWTHGEEYLLVETGKTLAPALDALATGVDVRLDWPAKTVYRDGNGVTVRGAAARVVASFFLLSLDRRPLQRRARRHAPRARVRRRGAARLPPERRRRLQPAAAAGPAGRAPPPARRERGQGR